MPGPAFYASGMGFWRNNRRYRRLCGWLAVVAMAAHLGLGVFSGLAQAAGPSDRVSDDWPFGDLVICTANGIQHGDPADDTPPSHHPASGDCDACASACCGGAVCSRVVATVALRQAPNRVVVSWSFHDWRAGEPAVVSAFSSRAPPFSA
jgi:hypothetical protein